ncbi:hypothetical protein [Kitasatospora sp. MAP5-34]|uniref:hypothetical protein n=1 Tax=Kitasatospora sp. MAP5-34 TaxID=3035102 RepID=UPI00247473DF|nr:hypothetical protein [Kitasatospora sp. MAP5-34]MDH6580284.1 hypothetical protein [Kitasatospora sp. MAP5-34]
MDSTLTTYLGLTAWPELIHERPAVLHPQPPRQHGQPGLPVPAADGRSSPQQPDGWDRPYPGWAAVLEPDGQQRPGTFGSADRFLR